jgi:chromosomal replication initiator protein
VLAVRQPVGAKTLARIAAANGIAPSDLTGPERPAWLVELRHECMWVLRQLGMSYPSIGRVMKRDHTSVMNGVRRHEQRMEKWRDL